MTTGDGKRTYEGFVQACADIAGLGLVALMLITVIDIFARRFGLFSVRGIVEISTLCVVLIGFLALANSFKVGGHIIVDLATSYLPDRINQILDSLWLLLTAICLLILAVMMWQATWKSYEEEAVSLDLQMPMFWFWTLASVGVSLAPIACVIAAIVRSRGISEEAEPPAIE